MGASLLCLIAAALLQTLPAVWATDQTDKNLFWGTYRPNLYFGAKTASPESILSGLMWHGLGDLRGFQEIRHACEQGDNLNSYAWRQHDGSSFGRQSIVDGSNNITLYTEFLKSPGGNHGGDWTLRVTGKRLSESPASIAVYFYVATDRDETLQIFPKDAENIIKGSTVELGDFSITIVDDPDNNIPPMVPIPKLDEIQITKMIAMSVPKGSAWKLKEKIQERLLAGGQSIVKQFSNPLPTPAQIFSFQSDSQTKGNVIVVQKMLQAPFQFDIAFISKSAHGSDYESPDLVNSKTGKSLSQKINEASEEFSERFERTYQLRQKGFDSSHVELGQMLLSNLIGGIGFFHGTNIVDRYMEGREESTPVDFVNESDGEEDDYFDEEETENKIKPNPKIEGPNSLFTAVPSRPFFPRGFLWDEGFHELIIGSWDSDISTKVISSWANRIEESGWVAREQILGDESASKVPQEFQVQYAHFGNPPTLVLALTAYKRQCMAGSHPMLLLQTLNEKISKSQSHIHQSEDVCIEFLQSVYQKFKSNYLWFRNTQWGEIDEWGRDPSNVGYRWRGRSERHTLTSGLDDYPRPYPAHAGELHVDLMSWVGVMAKSLAEIASTIGESDDAAKFETHFVRIQKSLDDLHWNEEAKAFCDATVDNFGQSSHVVHLGYLSLFPFILDLVPSDSPKMGDFLNLIYDSDLLWTRYGLRSLSRADPNFSTDENYWRGPIWMNINYLVLRRLYQFKQEDGEFKERATTIYNELRSNIIANVHKEYVRTGYVWEQYSAVTGEGQRSHPFTGWTSLVLLMMAEIYN